MLKEMLQSLTAHQKENGTIILNSETMGTKDADFANALSLLKHCFNPDADLTLKLSKPPELSQDEQTLVLESQTVVADQPPLQLTVILSLTPTSELTTLFQCTLPDDWRFSDSFPALTGTPFDGLQLADPHLFFSSHSQQVSYRDGLEIKKGVTFAAEWRYTNDLKLINDNSGKDPSEKRLALTGEIDINQPIPAFEIKGQAALPELTLNLLSLAPQPLKDGELKLTCRPSSTGEEAEYSLKIAGKIGNPEIRGTIDVPTTWYDVLFFDLAPSTAGKGTPEDALKVFGDTFLSSVLPDVLHQSREFSLSNIQLQWDPQKRYPTLLELELSLTETESINLFPGTSLKKVKLNLEMGYYPFAEDKIQQVYRGAVSGKLTLSSSLPELDIQVYVPNSGDWLVSVGLGTTPLSLSQLTSATNGDGVKPLLELIKADQTPFPLARLNVAGNPFKPSLNFISATIRSQKEWPITTTCCVTMWAIHLKLDHSGGTWKPSGLLKGILKLGAAETSPTLKVALSYPPGPEGWTIKLGKHTPLPIGLGTLFSLIEPDFKNNPSFNQLPAKLQETDTFLIEEFSIGVYPDAQTFLKHLHFKVSTREPWVILTDRLAIQSLMVDFKLDYDQAKKGYQFDGLFKGQVTLHTLTVSVSAQKKADTPWELATRLTKPVSLDFRPVLTQLHPEAETLAFPTENFPQKVILKKFEFRIVPPQELNHKKVTETVHFSGDSELEWPIKIGATTITVTNLGGSFDMEKKPDSTQRTYQATLYGKLNFNGLLSSKISLQLGNTGNQILKASLERVETIKLDALVNDISGANPDAPDSWNKNLPQGTTNFEFKEALLQLNLTQKQCLLYGNVKNLGQAMVLVQELNKKWGFFFAAKLDEHFTFAAISQDLKPIDDLLKIKQAELAVAYFPDTDMAALNAAIDPLFKDEDIAKCLTAFTKPDGGNRLNTPAPKGFHLAGELEFSNAKNELANLTKINSGLKNTVLTWSLDVGLGKNINESVLTAGINDFPVSDTVTFKNIGLSYTAKDKKLALNGEMSVTLDDTLYDFKGTLTVDNKKASFTLSIDNKTTFTVLDIAVKNIALKADYTFSHDEESAKAEFGITGTLHIKGTEFTVSYQGAKGLISGTMTAEKPLRLSHLLNAMGVTGTEEGFDIGLKNAGFFYAQAHRQKELFFYAASDEVGKVFVYAKKPAPVQEKEQPWQFACGFDCDKLGFATLTLPDIPLVKEQLQASSISLKSLHLRLANAAVKIDPLPDNKNFPIKEPVEITKGVSLSGELSWGEQKHPFELPAKDTPPKLTSATGLQADEEEENKPDDTGGDAEKGAVKWFSFQKSAGPLHVNRLGLAWKNGKIWLMVDGGVTISVLTVDLLGLSVGLPPKLPQNIQLTDIAFALNGLALAFKTDTLEISGGLLKSGDTEFDGQCLIRAASFGISGLGSYAEITDPHDPKKKEPSLFIYAALFAPLGGPPYFFVEALAAGFGYNRDILLPEEDKVRDFPLVKHVMGEPPKTASPGEVLATMKDRFPSKSGQYWVAAGVRFKSFETIVSFALISVAFGARLEVALLGLSRITVPAKAPEPEQIAYAELQLMVRFTPDQGLIAATARLTPNSYVLDKKCRLSGGFAFFIWYKSQQIGNTKISEGDFAVTLGGYHPRFQKPAHYPAEPRLALTYRVNDSLSIKGECYFALTPSAVMAGARLEMLFQENRLRAWFIAYADFLMQWKPFYYDVAIGITIGASYELEVLGIRKTLSVELGADLALHGPPLAGIAHIHWAIISFTVEFGPAVKKPARLDWPAFRQSFLPEKDDQVSGVRVAAGLAKKIDDTHWVITPADAVLETVSAVPITTITLNGTDKKEWLTTYYATHRDKTGTEKMPVLGILPMAERTLDSRHSVTIRKKVNGTFEPVDAFEMEPVIRNVPQALWAAELSEADRLHPRLIEGVTLGVSLKPKARTPMLKQSTPKTISPALLTVESDKKTVTFTQSPAPIWEARKDNNQIAALMADPAAQQRRTSVLSALQQAGLSIPPQQKAKAGVPLRMFYTSPVVATTGKES